MSVSFRHRTDPTARPARRLDRSGVGRRSTIVLALLSVVVGSGVGVAADRPDAGAEVLIADEVASAPTLAVVPVPTSPSPAPSAPASSPSPVLSIPGPVPSAGRGGFAYAGRRGDVLGRGGVLRGYRVAVETGAGEDVDAFAAEVGAALAGPGSWVGSGRLRLQQVPLGWTADFTVYLATARTAGTMCAAGGVDIRVGGRPYTSCRASGKVIINLDRWRTSVPHFVRAGVPLAVYRTYVINHEVGHQLGHRHERCPGAGRPAPVMQQQTLFLDGCVANPWPYRNGKLYTGPAL